MKILPRNFYQRDTVEVAKELIGKKIVRIVNDHIISGIIVETEGYCYKIDESSHAYRGKTPRNEAMFGLAGCSYVYFIYGNHFCLNVVARKKDVDAGAVLIRAVEPVDGIEIMKHNRKKYDIKMLTNGPGKLTQAFGINKSHNGCDFTQKGSVYICESENATSSEIIATPRIGISVAQDKKWRFCLKSNIFLSR